jgi:hypothetical protein
MPVWGMHKTLSEGTVRVAMATYVDPGKLTCACEAGYCCSEITCAAQKPQDPKCLSQAKNVGGKPHVCSYSQADYQSIVNDPKLKHMTDTTLTPVCQYFVK